MGARKQAAEEAARKQAAEEEEARKQARGRAAEEEARKQAEERARKQQEEDRQREAALLRRQQELADDAAQTPQFRRQGLPARVLVQRTGQDFSPLPGGVDLQLALAALVLAMRREALQTASVER